MGLYCTVLYCTVLYCTVLYCTVLYCRCQEEARVWADLASIPDQRTSSFLVSLLPVAGSYWVGGRYDEGAGAWQWTDGTPMTFSSSGGAPPGSSGHQLAVRFNTGQWEHLP